MGAQVQVNGSTTRSVVVPYGSTVSLTNAAPTGTAQKWEVLDYPLDIDDAGPDFATNFGAWTLAGDGTYFVSQTPAYSAVTFKPDVTGTFIIRLTSTESGLPVTQTAVIRVADILGEYLPAAGESTESGTREGWKRIHNGRQKRLGKRMQGFIRVANVSGSSIARGKVVKLAGTSDLHTISPNTNPGGTAAAKVERVFTIVVGDNTAAGAASAHFVILDQALANNSVGWAQKFGLFEGGTDVSYAGFAVGDTLYLNSTGDHVNAPPGSGAKIVIGSVIGNGAGVGTATVGLPGEVVTTPVLATLATGLLKSTTATGALSIAAAGTDYESPLTISTGLTRSSNTLTANLVTGKAGGQTAIGGTAASETLTLQSTSHATKGKLLFGSSGYDEVNNRLGVKTASPTEAVEIASGCLAFSGSNTGPGALSAISGSSTLLQFWISGTSRLTIDSNGIAGSTSAAGNLQIQSTTNGTKGLILLGAAVTSSAGSAYNEALDHWSFGAGYAPGGPLAELIQLADAGNIKLGTTTGTKIGTSTSQKLGFFNATPVVQQTSGANLTNSVTSGGVNDTITDWTNLTTYSTDAAAIRNAVYQLARKLKQVNDGLRSLGFLS